MITNYVNNRDYIDVEIHATHNNFVNENLVLYSKDSARNGAKTFVKPFNKPQLVFHDRDSDPVGRILSFDVMDRSSNLDEPQDFIKLGVRISDKSAMEKVLNGLYYTCSVGASSDSIRCSICNQVITRDGLCEHEKGSLVDGKLTYWIVDEIEYIENSFVNDPADPFSRIVSIDVGHGFVAYKEFLDNKELHIKGQIKLEDNMTIDKKNLPANVFCGPGNTFPAIDKEHVLKGLELVDSSDFSDELKNKIKGSLYRKGSRHGVSVEDSILESNPDIKNYRINDAFSSEEEKLVKEFFKDDSNKDLIIEDEKKDESKEPSNDKNLDDFKKLKKDELIELVDSLNKENTELKDQIKESDAKLKESEDKVKELNDSLSDKDTILTNKENEIINMLDDHAKLEVTYKNSLIDSIVHEKYNGDNKDELIKKFSNRKIDSLTDTINDMRSEPRQLSDTRVDNNTLLDGKTKTGPVTLKDSVSDKDEDKYDIFYRK